MITAMFSADEVWKKVIGYEEEYEVSNYGRVRKLGKIKKLTLVGGKYLMTGLRKNGKSKSILVHRLVAIAFIENPFGKATVNHKDANKQNNNVSNLEWCTQQENIDHSRANHLQKDLVGSEHGAAILTESDIPRIREQIKAGVPILTIARSLNISRGAIIGIQIGRNWRHVK